MRTGITVSQKIIIRGSGLMVSPSLMVSLTTVALLHQVLRSLRRCQMSAQGDPLLSPPNNVDAQET